MSKKEDKKTSASGGESAPVQAVEVSAELRDVIVSPRLSEKSVALSEKGKYVFLVAKNANKVQVKKAIEKSYKVNVVQVNVVRLSGKSRNFGRTPGRTADIKKAIVTLKAGQKIAGALETV